MISGLRVGIGYDLHRLREGRPMILGGVTIPCAYGPDGHSDADVLTHALMDALLGAAGLGDIGQHFPPDDPAWLDADSMELLRKVMQMIRKEGYIPVNIDSVVVLEYPRLAPYREAMQNNLATAMGLSASQVSVKAKTGEGLGVEGRREGISAQAVVLLERKG